MGASGVSIQTKIARGGDVRPLYWCVSVAWLATLTWLVAREAPEILRAAPTLLAWTILLAGANLLPLTGWHSAHFAADLPIATAAALVLAPLETAIMATLGAIDPREITRKTSVIKALYNRSQIGVASASASLVCHRVAVSPDSSKTVIGLAFLALTIGSIVNYALVALPFAIQRRESLRKVLKGLRLGAAGDFYLSFCAWGVLSAMLAAFYNQVHTWALVAFLAPMLLARQVLARSQMWVDSDSAYRARERALAELSRQIDRERKDERRLIAADLHDEVMAPLYKVTLMSHVIKADLATGRLLEIDEDLPELLTAAELASKTLRDLIGDLRKSALGRGGLTSTLSSLVNRLSGETDIRFHTAIDRVNVDSVAQIAFYQIAKEAISNTIQHSEAENVWVTLTEDEACLRLEVRDDGIGFDPYSDKEGHYGIEIMRERAAGVDATLFIDSERRQGSKLTALLVKVREG